LLDSLLQESLVDKTKMLKKGLPGKGGKYAAKLKEKVGRLGRDKEGNVFLHGTMIIEVIAGKGLPDMEGWITKYYDKKDVTDGFVDVKLGNARIAKTRVIDNSLDPEWNETFRVEVCHRAKVLIFDVRDKDHATTEKIGIVEICCERLAELEEGEKLQGWYKIKRHHQDRGELHISVQFTPITPMADISQGHDVKGYFKLRSDCNVRLYQDTMVPKDLPWLNMVKGPDGNPPEPHSCWKDLYYDLVGAKHLITITGWSVWTGLTLFRGEEAKDIDGRTLGELLCSKADEGVEVKVMIWWQGVDVGAVTNFDRETYAYFQNPANYKNENNRVICAGTPRNAAGGDQLVTGEAPKAAAPMGLTKMAGDVFKRLQSTHHQKSVVCDIADTSSEDGKRQLVAYVGGLDLTNGRWDTPEHHIYKTLNSDHAGDFMNSNVKGADVSVGPREPWHDIHSRVEGPAARDVLENFIERWRQQGHLDPVAKDGPPLLVNNIDFVKAVDMNAVEKLEDPEREWNVQLLRSITSDSAAMKVREGQSQMVLTTKNGKIVDQSITQAYITSIRNAERFIYIENQYFMGSAYQWTKDFDVACHNTLPAEICAKIKERMFAGKRFTAYIVIPMWPEGDPTSVPMQAILHWQHRTMEMMYNEVGRALREANVPPHLGMHPLDWLIFFAPGIRSCDDLGHLAPAINGSLAEEFRKTQRQMIYVHSKMMIVDDSYIIVGSANINERSMAGTRDSEMALGCWQPHFSGSNSLGEVHMFRMSLWAEHLKTWEEIFREPESLECTQRVNAMSWENWQKYNYDYYELPKETLPDGHLLRYPIQVETNGDIKNLEGFVKFPDYPPKAKIFGTRCQQPLEKVTT